VSVLAYIDPTGGLPPSTWGMMLTLLLTAVGAGLTAVRLFGKRVLAWLPAHRRIVVILSLVFIVAGAVMAFGWFRRTDTPVVVEGAPRVLVLAFDGLDPRLLDEYLQAGRLPHFARLAKDGVYHPLPTSRVPQSPVAWSTFLTGADPSRHGVFDFIQRDPATYLPDLSLADRRRMSLSWQGTPLWERPALAKLGVTAQRLPMVFPPPKMNGRLLAGMGVWDVRGTEGTYFFYSTRPPERTDARGILFTLQKAGSLYRGEIPGPYRTGKPDDLREPFELELKDGAARLRIQRREYVLQAGKWSDWVFIEFGMGPLGLQRVPAITRVLLRTTGDEATLYVSPLNFDPRASLYPLSHPPKYAVELADAVGLYATRGMPFDTQAVSDGVLSDADFLEQVRLVTEESERMLFHELPRFRSGMLFAYFEGSDIVQHMFWRGIDPQHALHADPETQRNRDAIPRMYEQYDAILGRAREALGADGQVIVMSDHGFGPFRRAVHLNAILRERGFLAVKDDKPTGGDLLRDIDWSRTRVYALGFNAVYLNLAGREGQGIVKDAEAVAVADEVSRVLEEWRDPDTGEKPIKRVLRSHPELASKDHRTMPDLFVGYVRGYRASWETALGAVPAKTVEVNRKKWSGDHCIDASEVPGIFLSSDRELDAVTLAEVGEGIERYLAGRLQSGK
jgi:predicted AlkP superfamily phosphohydrolase/phosphomutase